MEIPKLTPVLLEFIQWVFKDTGLVPTEDDMKPRKKEKKPRKKEKNI